MKTTEEISKLVETASTLRTAFLQAVRDAASGYSEPINNPRILSIPEDAFKEILTECAVDCARIEEIKAKLSADELAVLEKKGL